MKEPLDIPWSPTSVKDHGVNCIVIGNIGEGKTTLMKTLFTTLRKEGEPIAKDSVRNVSLPFPMFVQAIPRILKNDWKHFPIHKKQVTSRRFSYLRYEYQNSIVLLEDLPSWYRDSNSKAIPLVALNNFLSTIRHWNACFFITTQSVDDVVSLLPEFITRKITHIALFPNTNTFKLKPFGVPPATRRVLDAYVKPLPRRHYLAIDIRNRLLLNATVNTNPVPLLRLLAEKSHPREVNNLSSLWVPAKKRRENQIVDPRGTEIVNALSKNPYQDLSVLAHDMNMAKQTMYNWVRRLKKANLLDSDIRYGAPRK